MKHRHFRVAAPAAAVLSLFVSCCSPFASSESEGPLLVMSWNVLSLFDPIDDGSEYSGFSVAKGSWGEAKYRGRIEAIGKVVLGVRPSAPSGPPGPDILCLVEIEKKSILEDLAKGPLAKCGYRWSAFAKVEGSPIGLGILSRLPMEAARAWGLDVGGRGRERPILEALFSRSGRPFAILLNHWKSKLEGAEATEASRIESARLLSSVAGAAKASSPGLAIVACGDFNEGPTEHELAGRRYATAFMPVGAADAFSGSIGLAGRRSLSAVAGLASASSPGPGPAGFVAFSPWDDSDEYSYVHRGVRERIDGFVLSPDLLDGEGLEYRAFRVLKKGLVDEEGVPIPWSNATAKGWSDHLPILLELSAMGVAENS
ncbi:MAG TPA: endonuclease/exonuclease/phosphatase family protein [Rectinemataceae bacterium]|nr:endonuclease/exonuclease/phosphatase family protein [Rectinemataceae bacterium]